MKTLIVYYSLEGNCAYVADKIAAATGADTLRLVPKKGYKDTSAAKFLWGGTSVMLAKKPVLEEFDVDPAAYERIVIGYPVWAASFAPPIRTFVDQYGAMLKDKDLVVFACQGGNGAEKSFAKLAKLIGVDELPKTAIFIDPKDRSTPETEAELEKFCELLK